MQCVEGAVSPAKRGENARSAGLQRSQRGLDERSGIREYLPGGLFSASRLFVWPLTLKMLRRCEMHLPGFTAEVSLYKTRHLYKLTAGFAPGTAKPTIIPQRIKLKTVHCACDSRSDICVCDDGSVFNDVTGLLDIIR